MSDYEAGDIAEPKPEGEVGNTEPVGDFMDIVPTS